MTFESITNRGEFFSNHYLDAVIGGDLNDLHRSWEAREETGDHTARSRLRSNMGSMSLGFGGARWPGRTRPTARRGP